MTDDRSTPPGRWVDADDYDDYDVSLEDPVIEDGVPTTWQEFAEDARKGESSNFEPTILGPEFGSATHPQVDRPAIRRSPIAGSQRRSCRSA
ncbi:hypothetical protein [Nocardia lijiangensis]|uniref:hypothetical protein n=1 Tax=Nocardia lijiangensis TaxID=299618 RepID=UPI003D740F80